MKSLFWLIIVVLVPFSLTACGAMVPWPDAALDPQNSSAVNELTPLRGQIKTNPLTFEFRGYRTSSHLRGEKPPAEGATYLIIYYKATNTGREKSDLGCYQLVVTTDDGRKFEGDYGLSWHLASDEGLAEDLRIQPSLSSESVCVMEFPEAAFKQHPVVHVGEANDYFGEVSFDDTSVPHREAVAPSLAKPAGALASIAKERGSGNQPGDNAAVSENPSSQDGSTADAQVAHQPQAERYGDSTWGFSFEVPPGIFVRRTTRDNHLALEDSSDMDAYVIAWKSEDKSEPPSRLRQLLSTHPEWRTTYKRIGPDYFIASGYDGNRIFYQKSLQTANGAVGFLMEYPKSHKARYDDTVEVVAKTFRAE